MDRNKIRIAAIDGVSRSLSARRAWIEMDVTAKTGLFTSVALRKESVDRNIQQVNHAFGAGDGSLSARRAWIEISKSAIVSSPQFGRSPQGERG